MVARFELRVTLDPGVTREGAAGDLAALGRWAEARGLEVVPLVVGDAPATLRCRLTAELGDVLDLGEELRLGLAAEGHEGARICIEAASDVAPLLPR